MTRSTLADLMRAPPATEGPDTAPSARKPGHWLRGDGTQVPIAGMNEHHRAAAARKARSAGDDDLARELDGSA